MKVERWEEETDEEWAERLAEEIAIADNTETTHYFVERDPYDEEGIIINYVGGNAITWKEHPEGPFKATQIIEWKNKSAGWDEVAPYLPKIIEILKEVVDVSDMLGLRPSTQTAIKEGNE